MADDAEVRERIGRDFAFFQVRPAAGVPDLRITALLAPPRYEALPPLRASAYTPRNICYADGPRTWIDYFGRGLAVYQREASTFEARATDLGLLHEIVYQTILSRVQEKLEERHVYRLPAVAIERGEEAALFLLPLDGDKADLTRSVLRRDFPVRILSEDRTIVDASARVLPFPLRLDATGRESTGMSPPHVARPHRAPFEPNPPSPLDTVPGRFCESPATGRFVFLGNRFSQPGCRFRRVGRTRAMKSLLRHTGIGTDSSRTVEFLPAPAFDLAARTRNLSSRLQHALTLATRAEVYELDLGPDTERNTDEILAFLERREFGGPSPKVRAAAAS